MQQLALPQPADSSAVPISGAQEVTIAMIGAAQQFTEHSKWDSLMIDSGAATPVCPPWFATQFPLQHLEHGTGPQLRTVTNQHIKLHGYRWVCVANHSGQQTVMPLYVCEHWMTIQDYSTRKDSTAHLENRDGLFFLQAEITTLPRGAKLQIHSAQPEQDWHELVRVHRQYWKTLFTPSRTQCPVPAEQLEDYRRIRSKDGTTNTFEDKHQSMEAPNGGQQQMWKGERAFRIKKGTALPETQQQQFATKTQPKSTEQKATPQVVRYNPRARLREKTTPPTIQDSAAPHHHRCSGHGLPHPSEVHRGGDYWHREGPHWKRVHIKPQTQHFTLRSRHMTGQTLSDLHLANRPRYNRQEDSTTQDW